jgi:hypothetical protein
VEAGMVAKHGSGGHKHVLGVEESVEEDERQRR